MSLRVLYFAWLRERIGAPSETLETGAATVADLVDELRGREDRYALAFSDMAAVRVAVECASPLTAAFRSSDGKAARARLEHRTAASSRDRDVRATV